MAFKAQYAGECPRCLGWFEEGTVIRYVPDEDKPVHGVCPDPLKAETPICPVCQLTMPKSGVCCD